ncbi:MAG: TIGR04053 family radical SAM/SPASM domain-containing protein [Armatimonadetes bacterium]|nr:TIGR04053 family radical SAM/SPASM domain-containing protein [Armatimonadota bacterium]
MKWLLLLAFLFIVIAIVPAFLPPAVRENPTLSGKTPIFPFYLDIRKFRASCMPTLGRACSDGFSPTDPFFDDFIILKPRRGKQKMNFDHKPFTVIWETTRACDLVCLHCRADALPERNPYELTRQEASRLIQMIKDFGEPYPLLILTGGDPMKRADIFDIVAEARQEGLRVAMTPSATPLVTRSAIQRLAKAGLVRLALSLDGSTPETHDGFRGVQGSFVHTLQILSWCREFGIETQIHTTVTKHSLSDLPKIADMLVDWGIKLWALFFLIAVGRAARPEIKKLNISPYQFEEVFHWLYDLSRSVPFDITPREGYHYRRVLIQRRAKELGVSVETILEEAKKRPTRPTDLVASPSRAAIPRAPLGVNDGKGVVFISHIGVVQPSGFLPLGGGNIRRHSLSFIYRESPLFRTIRNTNLLKGKCGLCEFKDICGGSRARAYAATGDFMRSDPYCIYKPKKLLERTQKVRAVCDTAV